MWGNNKQIEIYFAFTHYEQKIEEIANNIVFSSQFKGYIAVHT